MMFIELLFPLTNEETEQDRLSDSPKVTMLVNGEIPRS